MTDEYKVDFAKLAWIETAPGSRSKTVERGESRLRLVEFSPGFREEGWCTKAHRGYVVEGSLDLVFPDHTETLSAGDALFIPAGASGGHKAVVRSGLARLILADEA